MPSLNVILRDTMLLTAARPLPPIQPNFSIPEVGEYLMDGKPATARQLQELPTDKVLKKRVWHYQRSGLTSIRNLTLRNRTMGDMPMTVCESIDWGPVFIHHQGKKYELPLTADFLVRSYYLDEGSIPTAEHGLWQLPANIHSSFQLVFAFQAPNDASRTDWVKPTEEELRHFDFMPDSCPSPVLPYEATSGGGSHPPVVSLTFAPMRIVVVVTLVCCTERQDFDPKGILKAARFYPMLMIMSSMPLTMAEGRITVVRPSLTPMRSHDDEEMTDDIKSALFSDRNEGGIWNAIPAPYWHKMFSYYLAEPNVGDTFKMVDASKPTSREMKAANRKWDDDSYAERSVAKEPFQGEFDNIHLAPRFTVRPKELPDVPESWQASFQSILMAPFCAHDCLHMHTRWARWNDQKHVLGWSGMNPYSRAGAPLVPKNQTIFLTLSSPAGFRYDAEVNDLQPSEWQVIMHHGACYSISSGTLADLVRAYSNSDLILRNLRERTPEGWARIYWDLRYWTPLLSNSEYRERLLNGGANQAIREL